MVRLYKDRMEFSQAVYPEWFDLLGEYRIDAINMVMENALENNLHASYQVAITGAMRNPISLRPEVLIDAKRRLL